MAAEMTSLSYTWASADLINRIKDDLWKVLREKAAEKVRRDGRDLVTEEDVKSCLRDAFGEIQAREIGAMHVIG